MGERIYIRRQKNEQNESVSVGYIRISCSKTRCCELLTHLVLLKMSLSPPSSVVQCKTEELRRGSFGIVVHGGKTTSPYKKRSFVAHLSPSVVIRALLITVAVPLQRKGTAMIALEARTCDRTHEREDCSTRVMYRSCEPPAHVKLVSTYVYREHPPKTLRYCQRTKVSHQKMCTDSQKGSRLTIGVVDSKMSHHRPKLCVSVFTSRRF